MHPCLCVLGHIHVFWPIRAKRADARGMKSFLLNAVGPFLKKKNTGEIVPVKIGGTFRHPTYGLDSSP